LHKYKWKEGEIGCLEDCTQLIKIRPYFPDEQIQTKDLIAGNAKDMAMRRLDVGGFLQILKYTIKA
jgi:hypothetical protein